jgi:hypothetical protein
MSHRAPLTLPQFKFRGKYNSLEEKKDCLKYPGYLWRYVPEAPADGASKIALSDACAGAPSPTIIQAFWRYVPPGGTVGQHGLRNTGKGH